MWETVLNSLTGERVFRNRTPIAQAMRPTINKWELKKLKSFCRAKNTVSGVPVKTSKHHKLLSRVLVNQHNLMVKSVAENKVYICHHLQKFSGSS